MNEETYNELMHTFNKAIKKWWGEQQESDDIDWSEIPILHDSAFWQMAESGINVLNALKWNQDYLQKEKVLKP